MSHFRQIDIDLEVHKRIELAKRSFSETENEVLRRLLGIETTKPHLIQAGRPWSGKGVVLPHGTELQMGYNGQLHHGRIDEGRWLVEGESFSSPSAAAGGVALTKAGKRPSLDGWVYWKVKLPEDSQWVPLATLREANTGTN